MAKRQMPNIEPEQEQVEYVCTVSRETPKYGTVNCSRLNVRKRPHRSSEVLLVIEEDDVIQIMDSKSTRSWYYVKTDSGVEGYCMTDYIIRNK